MDVGRNDPCPCGSGKKYKKCCLDKDAAARSRDAAPAADGASAERLDAVFADATGARLDATLQTLMTMLQGGGGLASLRFDRPRFDAAIQRHTERYTREGVHAEPQAWLFEACVDELADAAFVARADAALSDYLRRGEPSDARRLAVEVAAAFVADLRRAARVPKRHNPLLRVVFGAQLLEGLQPFDALRDQVARLTPTSAESLDGLKPHLEALRASAPWLSLAAPPDSTAVERAEALLASSEPPAIFTPDQLLDLIDLATRFSVRLERPEAASAEPVDPKAACRALGRDMVAHFGPTIDVIALEVLDQLTTRIGSGALTRVDAERLVPIAAGLAADPMDVILGAVRNPAVATWSRFPEEAALARTLLADRHDRGALQAYAELLEHHGALASARRVRRLHERAEAAPVAAGGAQGSKR